MVIKHSIVCLRILMLQILSDLSRSRELDQHLKAKLLFVGDIVIRTTGWRRVLGTHTFKVDGMHSKWAILFLKINTGQHGSTLKSDSCHSQKGGWHTSYQGLPSRQGTGSRRPSTTASHYCQAPGLEWDNSMITNNGDDGSVVRTLLFASTILGYCTCTNTNTRIVRIMNLWIPYTLPFPPVVLHIHNYSDNVSVDG